MDKIPTLTRLEFNTLTYRNNLSYNSMFLCFFLAVGSVPDQIQMKLRAFAVKLMAKEIQFKEVRCQQLADFNFLFISC